MAFKNRYISKVPPQSYVVGTFVVMLTISWRKWTSMIVDIGRELDLPLRLMNGEMLYRDIHYLYPPFSPYFNSLLYRLFGVHLDTLAFSGIVFTAILIFLCYTVARRLMPAGGAAIAASLITIMSFKPAGNLILSYSFAGLHGAVFALASVIFVMRYAEGQSKRELIISGIFIGLATITKQEFGLASAATVTAYAVFLHRADLSGILRDVSLAAGSALLVVMPVFGWLFATIDWRILIHDCHLFYTSIPRSLEFYNRMRSGMNDPIGSFIQMVGAAAVSAAFVTIIVFLSCRRGAIRRTSFIWFASSSSIAILVLYLYRDGWDGSPLRALPFLLLAILVAAWRRKGVESASYPIDPAASASPHALFILAIYSMAILARVALRVPSGGFSGSFYIPTSLILIVYILLRELPQLIRKWSRDHGTYIRARVITVAFCTLAIFGTAISFTVRYRARFGHQIHTERGSLIAERFSGPIIEQTTRFIAQNTSPNETIAVLPEGNDLAFLTARRINLRHQVLIPDFLSPHEELDVINALEKGEVNYIFITNRPMREFGTTAFGKDFYTTLGAYIRENFETVTVFGAANKNEPTIGDPDFFIEALRRKEP